MGTDSRVTPHGGNLGELERMVASGMTPTQALISATRTAAALMGLADDRGTIEPGKRADLVLATGSATDVNNMVNRISRVIQNGRIVAHAD